MKSVRKIKLKNRLKSKKRNFGNNEDTAKSILVFLGFFYKSLDKLRRSYPSENVYYGIAKNGFEIAEREDVSYHLKDWIKVLRRIQNEVWY